MERQSQSQKILVIDDNSANRMVAEGFLVAAGYTAILAEDGESGIAAFKQRAPSLVLLDILMPGLSGFETCERLRELPGGKDVPIVFFTALSDLGSHQKAIDAGADDFLTKPINRTELLIRIRSLLRVKRLQDELLHGYELIQSQRDALLKVQQQKEELAALVVHDLKNPLTAILANAQFLYGASALSREDKDIVHDIINSTESMHKMVVNLLDISRSEDGTLVPCLTEVCINQLIQEICASHKQRCENLSLKVTCEINARTLKADKDLLHRLIENLFDNAIKYSPGGGRIFIGVESTGDDHLEIRVMDEGQGVPEDSREKIFQKYVQLDLNAQSKSRASRGLGLAFCRLAAEAHGGSIWVEDNQPNGAVFCVRIPAVTGPFTSEC